MTSSAETIGHSSEGRALTVHFAGSDAATTRVLVIAGQHGDERFARRAATKWLEGFQHDGVQVAALLDANPDGSHHKQRRNAVGVDLNRDHQLLAAPETQAMHRFARKWRPHLIIDVHTYPPRREHLLARGLVHANDVFIDIANNPTACAEAPWTQPLEAALPQWIEHVRKSGFRADRYTIITKGGTVRHSTPDVTDARNGLALALGVPTVLLEGRERTRFDKRSAKRRTIGAIVAALDTIVQDACVRWPAKAVEQSATLPVELPIRSRYVECTTARELEFFDAQHQDARRVQLPGPYHAQLINTQSHWLPIGYAIPENCTRLLDVLHRHGVAASSEPRQKVRTMQTHVRVAERSSAAQRPPMRLRTFVRPLAGKPTSHVIIPITPTNARLLSVFLEAHSKYALCRYPQLGIYPQVGQPYPILRLEPAAQIASCALD